ncbi:MAG: hypothetical protein KC410_18625 [Anaerolineales bacterium]|nr:hypothetical protein [Anaerolineales bacterium]
MSISTKPKAADMLRQMGLSVYRTAYEKGMSLSAYLEQEDPSAEYRDGTDAFQRLLQEANIRVEAVPQYGIQASTFEEFNRTEQTRALIPEWMLRTWREVQTGKPFSTRSLYSTADGAAGSWERPYAEAMTARMEQQVTPAIPLSELVAITTPINAAEYRAYYLTNTDDEQLSLRRVAEGAEVPRYKLNGSDHVVNLLKYGGALEASYEMLRRQRIDKLALHVRLMAVQAEVDKVAAILDVMVNGDGNNNAPTTYALTTLDDDATAGTLTLPGWLAYKMKFANPYMLTGALAQESVALQMMLLTTGSANVPLVTVQQPSGLGAFTPINPGLRDSVALGWTSDAPAQKIVGFDRRFAIERIVDVGATITEIEQFITRQVQVLVMTEAEGYAIIDKNAINILNVNA